MYIHHLTRPDCVQNSVLFRFIVTRGRLTFSVQLPPLTNGANSETIFYLRPCFLCPAPWTKN